MSALTYQYGFKLTTPLEAQRGMTEAEAYEFLATGAVPDLSQPPSEPAAFNPTAQLVPLSDARAWLSGERPDALIAAATYHSMITDHGDLQLIGETHFFKFNPNQPRDSQGKWTDGPPGGGGVSDFPSPGEGSAPAKAKLTGRKVTPAVIYKKHADGAVVAEAGDRRMRWDGGARKFVVEERSGGDWQETAQLTKTAAYSDLKVPDRWFEPGSVTAKSKSEVKPEQVPVDASSETPEPAPAVAEPTAKTAGFSEIDVLRDDPLITKSLADKNAFMASHGGLGVPNDIIMEAIVERRGFDGRPKIVSESAVDAALKSGQPELMRAFQQAEHADNFKTGPFYGGIGDQGSGTYFSYRPGNIDPLWEARLEEYGPERAKQSDQELADFYQESVEEMRDYMRRRAAKIANRMRDITQTYGQTVLRGTISPDVDVKTYDEVVERQRAYVRQLEDELVQTTDLLEREKIERWIRVVQDEGRFAALDGVRAYYGRTPGELIAVDRSAVQLQDGPPRAYAPIDFEVKDVSDALTAAAEVHTGAMIALVPTEADAQRIAVDGGEDVEQLHLTICYLGEAALIPPEVREQLVDCVSECAARLPTITGAAFSVAVFNPLISAALGAKEPCVVLGITGSLLERAYDIIAGDVYETLDLAGVSYPAPHSPWVPHVTLLYTDDADISVFADKTGPIAFDRVRLAFGGEIYDIPIGVESITAAFDPNQPRGDDGRWIDQPGEGKSDKINFTALDTSEFATGQVVARGTGGGMSYEVVYDGGDDSQPYVVNMTMPNNVTVPLKSSDPSTFGDDIQWQRVADVEIVEAKTPEPIRQSSTTLTTDEQSVVDGYLTEVGNRQYNDSLRRGEGVNEWAVAQLDSAINKHRTSVPRTTYRGVSLPPGQSLNVGDTFTDPAYVSTTSDLDLAREFAQLRTTGTSETLNTSFVKPTNGTPVVMAIKVPKGLGFMPGDRTVGEWVLPRGRRFRVVGVRDDGVLDVEVLGE